MMFHSSSSSSTIISTSTFLGLLAASASSIQLVAAKNKVTTDDLYAKKIAPTAAAPGFNVEGGSVFTNYADTYNNEQLFFIGTASAVYEKPESEPASGSVLTWCSDLTFSDVNNSSLMGYAGRCVAMFLVGYAELAASGAEVLFMRTAGIVSLCGATKHL